MAPYFREFENRRPPVRFAMSPKRVRWWQFLAGLTIGFSVWYLHWRWTSSLNADALIFSILVATAETLFFIGTLIFFHDIWAEGDTDKKRPPSCRRDVGADTAGPVCVDVFITTFDEDVEIVKPTIVDAKNLQVPKNVVLNIWILDDGRRAEFHRLSQDMGVGYFQRTDNRGFKAGNLKNALLQTSGDFIVICDADTRVFPRFLENTLGYFRDPNVAWVQTPHWFYDIPEGVEWRDKFESKLPHWTPLWVTASLAWFCEKLSGQTHVGRDPMLSEPAIFFDVIQRRRNRNGASFCCGAGSVHRREALLQVGLQRYGSVTANGSETGCLLADFEPFKFHVSEDIYTSILLHSDPEANWKSVYHPDVESRMLSPWTIDAWTTQKLKYAGGTFDIMLKDNPIFNRGMSWQAKLHYLATFWSYLSILWMPIMMFAPVFSLFTGWAPVDAYSLAFFAHILPVLIVSEIAMVVGCKGHNVNVGRLLSVGGFAINLRALVLVLMGKRPKFPATPKTPVFSDDRFSRVVPNVFVLALMISSVGFGLWAQSAHVAGYSSSFLLVNIIWIAWNSIGHFRMIAIAMWRPDTPQSARKIDLSPEKHNVKGAVQNASV